MHESMATPAAEIPPRAGEGSPADAGAGGPLDDPRALQILSTEHWSLLATRSLSYNETFTRAGIFLTFLGTTLVGVGLIATATGPTPELGLLTAVVLATDLFIGLATLGRIAGASTEELMAVAGMNRIRHAYREMVPGIEPYFSTPFHDDPASVLSIYGDLPGTFSAPRAILHGLTTLPAMIGVVDAVVAGALAAVVAMTLGGSVGTALVGAVVAFVVVFVGGFLVLTRSIPESAWQRDVRFPAPRG